MAKIVRPYDWQHTSPRPIISIDRAQISEAVEVRVVLADEYFDKPMESVVQWSRTLGPEEGPVATFQVDKPLPDGQYVVFAMAASAPDVVVTQSGFFVRDVFRDVTFPISDAASEAAFRTVVMPPGVGPMWVDVKRDGSVPRRINIVLPSLLKSKFSGGPNTAFALGQVIAQRGVPVNFMSSNTDVEEDHQVLRDHLTLLTGIRETPGAVTFSAANNPRMPALIGHKDLMMGTAWWTVQQFKHALAELRTPRYIYLVQDFESALYPHSTQYALAEETYAMDHLPLFNHRFLYEYFRANRIGCFARFADGGDGCWFDPVVDSNHFFFDERLRVQRSRTLLFYARPTIAVRNLYEIGYAGLARLAGEGAFDEGWSLYSMGERFGDIYLPRGHVVEELPWMGFDDYASKIRSCDVLLSLMLSPHPSYPPLEGAASGAIVVTNEFANKTSEEFATVSRNILSVPPSIDGVTEGLRRAIASTGDVAGRKQGSRMSMPRDWPTALAGAADRVVAFWKHTA